MKKTQLLLLLSFACFFNTNAQHSVAYRWNEAILQAVREDFARPPITARNLFHTSIAMYDAWAAYDSIAKPYVLGNTINGVDYPFAGIPASANLEADRNKAISFAVYRVAFSRYLLSPNAFASLTRFINLMTELGYDINDTSTDYSTGNAAALGNIIGQYVINMGLTDGSNEANYYATQNYSPSNPPLDISIPGNPFMQSANNWQPLSITGALDQNGNPIPSVQGFQSPEWGRVTPFAMTMADRTDYYRNGFNYPVYHDPGVPPKLHPNNPEDSLTRFFKWGHSMVTAWGSHHTVDDSVMWDISPGGRGNVQSYPHWYGDFPSFYNFENGGDTGTGHPVNPATGLPYAPQWVKRGDYTRVVSQFWADGPMSETPPGHWFTLLNYIGERPELIHRFGGKGPVLDRLEWDVKMYFALGGAMHDAAIGAWGMKGWYDSVRPISALRYMTDLGQSSDPAKPFYHPAGIELIPGFIEQIEAGDTLAGPNGEYVGRIKFYTWKGHKYITAPTTERAGVGWIRAEEWTTYQRKTFVTPPFAGFVSGHSTYSRAAADILTQLTGDPYFPGGIGEYVVHANSNYLVFEEGPSQDIHLQWATYRDASDQSSLSRIWGGIHPPFDDIPGRELGSKVASAAFVLAEEYFYNDDDQDGYYSYEDCNDNDASIYPNAPELCDNVDNNCNGQTDENAEKFPFWVDTDHDGFGDAAVQIDSCAFTVPAGYAANPFDCDDTNADIYPGATEFCDGKDNNCDGAIDENFPLIVYYSDADGDGYGDGLSTFATCQTTAPTGYTDNADDCDDMDANVHPGATEFCDGIDNNCDGTADEGFPVITYYNDADNDGFGDNNTTIDTCGLVPPAGYVPGGEDCDDNNAAVYPSALEILDGFDNDCNGLIDDVSGTLTAGSRNFKVYPNPVSQSLFIEHSGVNAVWVRIVNATGQQLYAGQPEVINGLSRIDLSSFIDGIYFMHIYDRAGGAVTDIKLIKQ